MVWLLRCMGVAALLILAGIVLPVRAQSPLRELATGDDGKGWEAVGRINLGRSGFCTGALIAPNLVLTAAHCLYDPHTGGLLAIEDFEFLAGWRNGRAEAHRRVRRTAAHPEYIFEGRDKVDRVAFDVAILELDQPIRNPAIRPFATAERPVTGESVGIVSYARGRDDAPTLEELCVVMAHRESVLMLSCDVDFGASGAPIFRFESGEPQIVSVVSAKAQVDEQRVALAAELGTTLATVRGLLDASDGVFHRVLPPSVAATADTPANSGGAKFVRP